MKKRLFVGALALLMIIGLLPVSSMLKKPVEAKAAEQTLTHTLDATSNTSLTADNYVGSDGFFSVGSNAISTTSKSLESYKYAYDMKNNKRQIKFTVRTEAKVTINWTSNGNNKYLTLTPTDTSGTEWSGQSDAANTGKLHTSSFDIKSGSYVLTTSSQSYLFDLKVVTTGNTITINDEKADGKTAPKTIVTSYSDGDSVKLSAKGTNLLYWKNSNDVIVATGDKGIPVYYSDTYTAVYAKEGAKVEYLTPYGGVLETYYADDEITEPGGPTRYGYTFDGWDTDIDTVKTSLANGKDVTVKPKYKDNTDLQYKITIDTTEFGGSQSTDTYTVNTEVKASATSDDFAYWADGEGNVLSYNSTYYFLANRDVTVKAVKNGDGNKAGIITYIGYKSKTIIFEYTVPDGYTMKFAGVYASTNKANVEGLTEESTDIPAGVYKLGADESRCSNYKTFRFTLKNSGIDTWYAKPVLTYKDASGAEKTIVGSTVYTMD